MNLSVTVSRKRLFLVTLAMLMISVGVVASLHNTNQVVAALVADDPLPSTEPIPGCVCDGGGSERGPYCGCYTVNQTSGKENFSDPDQLTELGCATMGPDFEATACYMLQDRQHGPINSGA